MEVKRPGAAAPSVPPMRPSARQERLAAFLLRALSPRLKKVDPVDPPSELAPFERFEIQRSHGAGSLGATWYPAAGEARGAVVLVHPWVPWGQAYFHRRGRLPILRAAGYHALTFDLGGVGQSGRAPRGFYADDVEDAVRALERRARGLPMFLWGVSAGGYWSHPVLSRRPGIRGAFFEDVALHLLSWSWRQAPWGFPGYLFFEHCLPRAYQFLDLRRHAPFLRVAATAYASGEDDRGVRHEETRQLARLARGECLIVRGADHLQAAKVAEDDVAALAIRTFELADRRLALGRDVRAQRLLDHHPPAMAHVGQALGERQGLVGVVGGDQEEAR